MDNHTPSAVHGPKVVDEKVLVDCLVGTVVGARVPGVVKNKVVGYIIVAFEDPIMSRAVAIIVVG